MLPRLPHEVRLEIFRCVFAHPGWCQDTVRVKDTAEGITYKFKEKLYESKFDGAISCLDAAVVGECVAAAAAEALYQSKVTFAVDATTLPTFLQSCPLSLAVEPGRCIKKLALYMDEDPNFIGDGKDRQALRKADWVNLESGAGDDRMTRSGHRTQLMRHCWRAILNMPKLERLELWITPSQGKVSASDMQHWEIRDIIPTHFRLVRKRVHASIYLRTWEVYEELDSVFDSKSDYECDDDGFYESYVNLDWCMPYQWRKPARQDGLTLFLNDHATRAYDALHDLVKGFKSDNLYKWTTKGKTRRKRKRASDGNLIEAGSRTKRRCRFQFIISREQHG